MQRIVPVLVTLLLALWAMPAGRSPADVRGAGVPSPPLVLADFNDAGCADPVAAAPLGLRVTLCSRSGVALLASPSTFTRMAAAHIDSSWDEDLSALSGGGPRGLTLSRNVLSDRESGAQQDAAAVAQRSTAVPELRTGSRGCALQLATSAATFSPGSPRAPPASA